MDFVKHRFVTTVEALTLRRAFAVSGIIAAFAFVAGIAPRISWWEGKSMLLETPAWAWGLMAGLVAALYFVFEYAHRKRMEVVPKFDVSFDKNLGIVQTPTKIVTLVNGQWQRADSNGVYVRIKIETLSKITIGDCVAFLTAIEKKDQKTKQLEPISLPFPIPLTQAPFSVHASIPRFVDFFQVGEADNVPQIPPPWPLTLKDAFQEQTNYFFTVSVVAGGVTKKQQVEVTWPGVWNGVSAVAGSNS
jgi:hypothetical protein